MTRYILFFATISILTSFSSCMNSISGTGPVTEVTREVSDFNKVALNTNATLLITQGIEQSVKVFAQENLHDVIMTRVDGKTLVITTKGTVTNSEPIMIEISIVDPESFEVNGSGEIKTLNQLKVDLIDLEVNGSGEIVADVSGEKISCAISGSGSLNLTGDAESFSAEINGSGKMNAENLQVASAKVKISGSGKASVHAANRLKAEINGSGVIRYKGTPHLTADVNGSGSVKAIN